MTNRAEEILSEAREALSRAADAQQVEALRVRYLGRKGMAAGLLASIPTLPVEDRPAAGRAANSLKAELTSLVREAAARLEQAKASSPAVFDSTLPGRRPPLGHIHPLSQTTEEICDIFRALGFTVVEGPEVELRTR